MVVTMPPPPDILQGMEGFMEMLGTPNPRLAAQRFWNIGRAVLQGNMQASNGGVPLTLAHMDALCDYWRPWKDFPIRPGNLSENPAPLRVRPPPQSEAAAPFLWRWFDLPTPWLHAEHDIGLAIESFPLPVAKIVDPHPGGPAHLVSLSAIWHLLPNAKPVAEFFNPRHRDFWAFAEGMGVLMSSLVPSMRARAALEKSGVAIPSPSPMQFHQFMGTPGAWLAALGWVGGAPNQSQAMQRAVLSMLGTVCASLPPSCVVCGMPIALGKFPGALVRQLLHDLDLDAGWGRGCVGLWPSLESDVPVEWVVWLSIRASRGTTTLALGFCRAMLAGVIEKFEDAFPTNLHDRVPVCRLPAECTESLKSALKGDDKTYLTFNRFLARDTGFSAAENVILHEVVYTSNFGAYVRYNAKAMVASYLALVAEKHSRAFQGTQNMSGDVVMFDASRVCKLDLLLVHLQSNEMYTCAPVTVLKDQSGAQTPTRALAALHDTTIRDCGRKGRRAGEATRAYCLAVFRAVFTSLHFLDCSAWISRSFVPGTGGWTRHTAENDHQYYYHTVNHVSNWCLSIELQRRLHSLVRVLVFAADEGSEGWSLFNFLANYVRMRIMFFRDPPHRLSNLFTNAMRTVPSVMISMLKIHVIHKYRRAPFGGGKFWRELQETLRLLLDHSDHLHPMIDIYATAIARDHNMSPDRVANNPALLQELLRHMLVGPLGPKVELRRWWTFYDAGRDVDKMWHTMLLSLVVLFGILGEDASVVARTTSCVVGKDDMQEVKTFKFKVQTLVTLFDSRNQRVLRSVLCCFKRIRKHHGAYIEDCLVRANSLRYQLFWSCRESWIWSIVSPTLHDSIADVTAWINLGFGADVEPVDVHLLAGVSEDADEDQDMLVRHVRLTMSLLQQLTVYVMSPQSPPWCYCGILSTNPGRKLECVAHMRKIHMLILLLESSRTLLHARLFQKLTFIHWAVVREPLELYAAGRWDLSSPYAEDARAYVQSMHGGESYLTTLALENGFNDLRDNEQRGARHKQRSPNLLQALAISSMATRYKDKANLVELNPEDVARADKYHCRPQVFQARGSSSEAEFAFNPDAITEQRRNWTGISLDSLVAEQSLFRALLETDESQWAGLAFALLFRQHMVVKCHTTDIVSYVYNVFPWYISLLDLRTIDGVSIFDMDASPDRIRECVPITSYADYCAYDHQISLNTRGACTVRFTIIEAHDVVSYAARTFAHLYTAAQLRQLLDLFDVKHSGNKLNLVELLLDYADVTGDEKEAMLDLVRQQMAKRARRTEANAAAAETDVADDADHEDEPPEAADIHAAIPPILADIAPAELMFAINGCPAGGAIMEEEEGYPDDLVEAPSRSTPKRNRGSGGASTSCPPWPTAPVEPPLEPPPSHPAPPDAAPAATRAAIDVRFPREDEMVAPPGCTLRCYTEIGGKASWLAKLPPNVTFEGYASHRRNFGTYSRTKLMAQHECWTWLGRAEASGVLTPMPA